MQTSLRGIANKAETDRAYKFRNLINLLTVEFLLWSWTYVNKKAAAGVDQERAYEYELNLVNHAETLVESIKVAGIGRS